MPLYWGVAEQTWRRKMELDPITRILVLAIAVVVFGSVMGVIVRFFGLKIWHLALTEALGFLFILLSDSRVDNIFLWLGLSLLLVGGGGLIYMWYLSGAEKQKVQMQPDKLAIVARKTIGCLALPLGILTTIAVNIAGFVYCPRRSERKPPLN